MADDRTIIDCTQAEVQLQEWMDGSSPPTDDALQTHLKQCEVCRSRFRMAETILTAYSPKLSDNFTNRVTVAVARDHSQRMIRRYFIAATGLAAAIAVAIWLANPPRGNENVALAPPTPSLEKQMARATTAVRDWTDRTVQSWSLPDVRKAELLPADGMGNVFEPAATTLADAGKGVAGGLEPLTASAKRAATRFWRDLPLSD